MAGISHGAERTTGSRDRDVIWKFILGDCVHWGALSGGEVSTTLSTVEEDPGGGGGDQQDLNQRSRFCGA